MDDKRTVHIEIESPLSKVETESIIDSLKKKLAATKFVFDPDFGKPLSQLIKEADETACFIIPKEKWEERIAQAIIKSKEEYESVDKEEWKKLPPREINVKCPKCKNIIVLYSDQIGEKLTCMQDICNGNLTNEPWWFYEYVR